jgi:hypothetical protein
MASSLNSEKTMLPRSRFNFRSCFCTLLTILSSRVALAQVGNISNVNYPGWIPADRAAPLVYWWVDYDAQSGRYTYTYTMNNRASAEQAVIDWDLDFNAPAVSVARPSGWTKATLAPPGPRAGVLFSALLPNIPPDPSGSPNGPAAAQIPPGGQLEGFVITSLYPPGYARTYVKGFAPTPYPPASADTVAEFYTPDDTTDSQRGWLIGPWRWERVITPGGGGESAAVDNFVGFMSLDTAGTSLETPAIIALKFSLGGETVDRNSLRVTLNGVNVTQEFHPGPSDGADIVGVFARFHSPVTTDAPNVLVVTVDGIDPATGQGATDTDRAVFTLTDSRTFRATSPFRFENERMAKKPKKP